ncbi:FAD/NAD(P)-binding oxidoreductase [Blastococcus jejuensis]|uniref:FAD/NAD(P)-binding oxidoreductase n=1 Tax=Blastococcus jejuensis TaxID=351224 RepID=A0ABP6P1J8_9ACTN
MSRRVVVLGGGAGGLAAANRLAQHGAALEVVLVDRSADHVFAPGFVAVMFGEAEPEAFRRPLRDLLDPAVRLVTGEATQLDVAGRRVRGSFGDLEYDDLVLALGAEVGWPLGPPPSGDLAPWTLDGALAGASALTRLGPRDRVVVGPTGVGYRCPPAVFDLAVRIRRVTGARVDVVHPWPAPLAPFGPGPSAAATRLLADAGVGFHGGFEVSEVDAGVLVSASGDELPYDAAFVVPPHRPPSLVADSPLAGPGGWPVVRFPSFGVDGAEGVSVIGDLASASLKVGMAGTLAVHEAAFVADRIAAVAGGPPAREHPVMSAICFLDTGETASFLQCDFTGPASGAGPAACTLMPWLPYFRAAKRLFAEEWFATTVRGGVD